MKSIGDMLQSISIAAIFNALAVGCVVVFLLYVFSNVKKYGFVNGLFMIGKSLLWLAAAGILVLIGFLLIYDKASLK
jgi:hypothetical protein